MEPITLVHPRNGEHVVVTVPTEEHNLRAQGYREPAPVVPVEVEVSPVVEEVPVTVEEDAPSDDVEVTDDEPVKKRR